MRFVIALVILLAGCAPLVDGQRREEEMLVAGAALTKVTAAAEVSASFGNLPDDFPDQKFLEAAVAHDPPLLAPLSRYQVKAIRKNGHAVVLVCSSDGIVALLEDDGCTAALDKHYWLDSSGAPCKFSIEPGAACNRK